MGKKLSKESVLAYLTENKEYLFRRFHLSKLGVFGSYASNVQTDQSDIDLLIELEDSAKHIFELKRELRSFLENQFQCEIDLAREKYLKPYVKQEILDEVIYDEVIYIE